MRKVLLSTFLTISIVLSMSNVQPASIIVLNGLPMKKVTSDIEGTELVNLTETEKFSYRLLITKEGKKYIWSSRENKELIFSQNIIFYDFVEPNGRGYIRVSIVDGKCFYMEHLTMGFKNITYWGIAEECNIK